MSAVANAVPSASRTDPDRSIDELDAAICRLASRVNAVNYQLLVLVREFDDRLGWAKWSFPSCAEWLSWRCGISLSAAREKVRTAQALRDLPGDLARVSRRAAVVHEGAGADARGGAARRRLAGALCARCDGAAGRGALPADSQRAPGLRARRAARVGGALVVGVAQCRARHAVLARRAAARGRRARHAGDRAGVGARGSRGRRCRDVAVELPEPTGRCVGGDREDVSRWRCDRVGLGSASTADRYQVVVHVDEAALRGGVGRADAPLETVKRLACDASLVVVTEDERGTPLSVGRKHRAVSTSLRRALWSRDRGCTFPGCHRTRFVDAHHVQHWVDGGETSVDNLVLLCSYHHQVAARRRLSHSARLSGRVLLRSRGWPSDPALRISRRRLHRRRGSRIPPWRAGSTRAPIEVTPPWRCAKTRGVYRLRPLRRTVRI